MAFAGRSVCTRPQRLSRDGLVGYDAALTRLRSRVQFPVFVYDACDHATVMG